MLTLMLRATKDVPFKNVVSFEFFKRSPQPLKAGIVATAAFRRFLEFIMYSPRCMIAGSVVACSACDLMSWTWMWQSFRNSAPTQV